MIDLQKNILEWLNKTGKKKTDLAKLAKVNGALITRIIKNPNYEPGFYKALRILEIISEGETFLADRRNIERRNFNRRKSNRRKTPSSE